MTAKRETDGRDVQPSEQTRTPQGVRTLLVVAGSSAVGLAASLVVLPRVARVAAHAPTFYVAGTATVGFALLLAATIWRRSA
jgi:hypothetical protein